MTVEEFDAFGVIGAHGVSNAILLKNGGKQLHGKRPFAHLNLLVSSDHITAATRYGEEVSLHVEHVTQLVSQGLIEPVI